MSSSHLIPIEAFKSGFTTCTSLTEEHIQLVALEDKSLGVERVASNTNHTLVKPPTNSTVSDGQDLPAPELAWEAFYPKGSINPSAALPGGFSFYLSGPPEFQRELETATEVLFSYRMMFQEGWEWVKGGKLPGIFGGVGDLAYGCSGGRQENRCQCIGLRPMWRSEGIGELYTYLPLTDSNSVQLLKVPPLSVENSDYGFSVGRGAFNFENAVGKWLTVAFRVRLNEPHMQNGNIDMWVNGRRVMTIDGLTLRNSEESRIRGMQFQTFFGGHTSEWASSQDQRAWFADVTGVIIT